MGRWDVPWDEEPMSETDETMLADAEERACAFWRAYDSATPEQRTDMTWGTP